MTFLIAAAATLLAQPAPATPAHHGSHAAPAAPTAATAQRFSVNTTRIADLLANPASKAVIDRHMPGFSSDARVGAAGAFTLKFIQPHSGGMITDALLAAIERDLAAIPAG